MVVVGLLRKDQGKLPTKSTRNRSQIAAVILFEAR